MWIVPCGYSSIDIWIFFWGGGIFSYSTLLHLPPLRFHCSDGCWDRTQDRLQLVHWQSHALTTRSNPLNLSLPSYLYSYVKLFFHNIFLNSLTFLSPVELSLVCEIIFLFLATWVAPLSSHFSTLGCWNLLSPGNFHLRPREQKFDLEKSCAILHFLIPFTKASSPPPPPSFPATPPFRLSIFPSECHNSYYFPSLPVFLFFYTAIFKTEKAVQNASLARQVRFLIFEQRQRLYPFKKRAMCSFDSHEYWFNCTFPSK